MWKQYFKSENGEFSIDAIFGITIFMVALIAIMFFSLIIRVQSNIQYALGQTAKEISGYYYLVDKIGLAEITAGSDKKTDVDKTIDSVIDFSTELKGTADTFHEDGFSAKDVLDFVSDPNNEINEESDENQIKNLYDKFDSVIKDVKSLNGDSFKQVLSVLTKTATNRAVNTFIAPVVSEKLMTKYLTSGDIQEYYDKMGISEPDFRGSQFLADKRSIKVEMCYKLNVKKYTLGFVDMDLSFRQVASTAAWVKPKGDNLISLSELSELY